MGQTPTPVTDRTNRVHWFAGRVHEVLDEVVAGGAAVTTLSAAEAGEAVTELLAAANRIHAVALAALAQADRASTAAEAGATSTGAWLAAEAMVPAVSAHRMTRLAKRLDSGDLRATAEAARAGALDPDQAQVIADAVTALPACVGAKDRSRAERHLLDLARDHDAKRLRMLARHLLHVIDPDAADQLLARQLEKEEAQARRRTSFKLFDDGQGTCHGTFRIPTLHGAMLATALNALASPKRPDAIAREEPRQEPRQEPREDGEDGALVQRAAPQVLGEAFCQYLERYPTKRLPKAGGLDATIVVTMTLESLLDGLTPATLSTGQQISATQARHLACRAGLIPAVLDGQGHLLDLGRKRRLHSAAQRIALTVRDQGCTVEGCTIPASWCHAHHDLPWASGGATSIANGRLLCPRHHTMVHQPGYQPTDAGNGRIRLNRRQ